MTNSELVEWIRNELTDFDTAELTDATILGEADSIIREAVLKYDTWHSLGSNDSTILLGDVYCDRPANLRAPRAVWFTANNGGMLTKLDQMVNLTYLEAIDKYEDDDWFLIYGQRLYVNTSNGSNGGIVTVEGYFYPEPVSVQTNPFMTDLPDYVKWGTLGLITVYDFEEERGAAFLNRAARFMEAAYSASKTADVSAGRLQSAWGG